MNWSRVRGPIALLASVPAPIVPTYNMGFIQNISPMMQPMLLHTHTHTEEEKTESEVQMRVQESEW